METISDSTKDVVCRLCQNNVKNQEFHVIDDVIKEVLTVVGLGLNKSSDGVVCIECFPKLFAAFDFKKMCLITQDTIFSYLNCEGESNINLREIYIKEKGGDKLPEELETQICRFCMELVNDRYLPLEQVSDSKIMCKYIPELNVSITKDPVICRQCSELLDVHTLFLSNCFYLKQKFDSCIKDPLSIKIEKAELTSEEKVEGRNSPEHTPNAPIIIKNEPEFNIPCLTQYESPLSQETSQNDNTDTFQSETTPKTDSLQRKRFRATDSYECDKCNYRTKFNSYLNKHKLVHKDHSELQIYKCDQCNFKTIHKYNLPLHQLKHKELSERRSYKCTQCDFQTVWKRCIIRHQLKHKDPLEVYKCDKCEFQAVQKNDLALHQLDHKELLERPIYKCDKCDFKVVCRNALVRHQLEHEDPSKVRMYDCDKCDYRTKRKENLVQHQIKHKDASEVPIYKCEVCEFKTKHKRCVLEHQLKHKDPSEVQMYECDQCGLKTKYKQSLLRHQMKHKN